MHYIPFIIIITILIFCLNSIILELKSNQTLHIPQIPIIDSQPFKIINQAVLNKHMLTIYPKVKIFHSTTKPSYFIVSHEGHFPYAEGDNAQQFILQKINLMKQCSKDNTTIIVDVGAYLRDF